ncbi:E3 ubiquitin-protein ligase [Yasminevirus sp. GU-2018]|uniref:E3 ubiquitin-protein ligase n=1 Tax=Yasminevirus sp. GU-2018 TaxID=2420051 RepID=A0A5K0U908_9VIRU|nr:E3 ubiquitin-protein ligase [Yasminevirus sp. GU-2018]
MTDRRHKRGEDSLRNVSVRDILGAGEPKNHRTYGGTHSTHSDDGEDGDDENFFVEEGSYSTRNVMNGYEQSDEDDMIDSVDVDADNLDDRWDDDVSSYEDMDEALARESASRELFEDRKTSENLNFFGSMNKNEFNTHKSVYMQQTPSYGSAQLMAQSMTQSTSQSVSQSIAQLQSRAPSIVNPSLNRFNAVITSYLSKPTGTLVLKDLLLESLPDIMKTMTDIKHLSIVQCELGQLKNLPPNLITLDIKCNKLVSLTNDDLPASLVELNANKNFIDFIDLTRMFNIKILNLSNNSLRQVVGFPPNTEDLTLTTTRFNNVASLKGLKNLKILKLNASSVDNLDDLPDTIVDLSISRLTLFGGPSKRPGFIQKLPAGLMKLVCHSGKLTEFGFTEFPSGLIHLDLYDNELVTLPKLPNVMTYVDLSKNNLVSVANVPTNIENYECLQNSFLKFTPEQMKILEHLKTQPQTTIKLNDDDDSGDADWLDFMTPRSVQMNENSRVRFGNDFGNFDYSDQPITFGTRSDQQQNQSQYQGMSMTQNPIHDRTLGYVDRRGGVDGVGSTGGVDLRNQMQNYFGNMRENQGGGAMNGPAQGGFGNFGSRSVFESRFGERASNLPARPQVPPYVARLMGSDGFVPTKDRQRKIRHQHIYYV